MHSAIDECFVRTIRSIHLEQQFGAQAPGLEFMRNESARLAIDREAFGILFLTCKLARGTAIELPGFEGFARHRKHRRDAQRHVVIIGILHENSLVQPDRDTIAAIVARAVRLGQELELTSADRS